MYDESTEPGGTKLRVNLFCWLDNEKPRSSNNEYINLWQWSGLAIYYALICHCFRACYGSL